VTKTIHKIASTIRKREREREKKEREPELEV
jgi:hypothetical protein